MKYLSDLKKLNLPSDKYAVFGGGPLAIRGLRDNEDLDIIVKRELWNKLIKKYGSNNGRSIVIGKIEIWADWLPWLDDINKLIDSADIIEGMRFVRLDYVLGWKRKANRAKDRNDIKLIENYLKKQE